MLSILYEDNDIIVVIKPAGLESQSGKSFAPDMVSEIRKHLASHPQDIHKITILCSMPELHLTQIW